MGIASSAEPDVTVAYDGNAASVHVQPKMWGRFDIPRLSAEKWSLNTALGTAV
jgi:hypothetical protein